jgi:hypothetical protein
MEFHALTQGAGPLGAVIVGNTFFGQRGNRFCGTRLILVERFENLSGYTEALAIGYNCGIQTNGIAATSEDEGIGTFNGYAFK